MGNLLDPFVLLERRLPQTLASPRTSFPHRLTQAANAFDPTQRGTIRRES
jgi:hypothetical protein